MFNQASVLGVEDGVDGSKTDVLVYATVAGHIVRVEKFIVVGIGQAELDVIDQELTVTLAAVHNLNLEYLARVGCRNRTGAHGDTDPPALRCRQVDRTASEDRTVGRRQANRAGVVVLIDTIANAEAELVDAALLQNNAGIAAERGTIIDEGDVVARVPDGADNFHRWFEDATEALQGPILRRCQREIAWVG